MTHFALMFVFLIGASFFATTDSAHGQTKEPAKEEGTSNFNYKVDKNDGVAEKELQRLMKRIEGCWAKPPAGDVLGSDKINVTIDIQLSTDGKIRGKPQILAHSDHFLADTVVASIRSALIKCQPYKFNPMTYEYWKHMRFNFVLKGRK